MSPLGIKRFVAFLLILSPWIFIPGLFKDIIFIVAGVLLFVSTLDLRRKSVRHASHEEVESMPHAESRETQKNFLARSESVPPSNPVATS